MPNLYIVHIKFYGINIHTAEDGRKNREKNTVKGTLFLTGHEKPGRRQ